MEKINSFNKLQQYQKDLINAAESCMHLAYNPYSKFYVGAALLTNDNKIFTGINVENASFSETICAERAAILHACSMGAKNYKAIAIIAKGEKFNTTEPVSPCGACRQMIFEFSQIASFNIEIIMSNTSKDKIIISSINELLPLAFGPKDLNIQKSPSSENC